MVDPITVWYLFYNKCVGFHQQLRYDWDRYLLCHPNSSPDIYDISSLPLRSPAINGASNGLNAQGQGGHVQQQQILSALAAQDSGLHGRTIGDSFIRVDAAVGLLTCNWQLFQRQKIKKNVDILYMACIYIYKYVCVYVKNI